MILVHGYSSTGEAFLRWKEILSTKGFANIHIVTWQSLVNEINIADIAEGFDRALRVHAKIKPNEPFDCMVHSTGMLVVRQWLARNPDRIHQLKHLIALAPATFGSPVARKGRSLLGSLFKGRKEFGPDFLEAGDLILDALELASPYTWNLSHEDLFGKTTYYGKDAKTPYVFAFCGDKTGFIDGKLSGPASDGVVRIAGASFNTRKISLNFSRGIALSKSERVKILPWTHQDSPVVPVKGANHGSIMDKPDDTLVNLVVQALGVKSWNEFTQWHQQAAQAWWRQESDKPRHQQIITHAIDERGDGIRDYAIKLGQKINGKFREVGEFDKSVAVYSKDPSYRCFHLDLDKLKPEILNNLWIKVILASGTHYAAYTGYDEREDEANWIPNDRGLTEVDMEITRLLDTKAQGNKFSLFFPRTTTFLELIFDREPMPLDQKKEALVTKFHP
ncbi:MAG: alpha/beta hydrolase [Blastochloris sp.]|nr:alpha/beta hydrolase [Blastochloris sp.]